MLRCTNGLKATKLLVVQMLGWFAGVASLLF
jgi:hypothetical protein